MTRFRLVFALTAVLLYVSGCGEPIEPRAPDHADASSNRFGVPPARVELVSRTVVAGDVVHYRYAIPVAPGDFDVIGLHRVVREPPTPHRRPVAGLEGVLMLPGAPQFFEGIFMPPATQSAPVDESSIALFLASNDVDVWGMDYGWTAVPHDAAQDFSPLRGWGMARDAQHVEIALSHARRIRATTGQGAGPIHLLGFSFGGFLAYAVAGEDTRRPGNLRNVKGIIPVDGTPFRAVSPDARAQACASVPAIEAAIAAGVHVVDQSIFRILGQAALAAPDEPSPVVPPFSNRNAPLVLLVNAGFLAGSIVPPDVTLVYTDAQRVIDLLAGTPPYIPQQSMRDIQASQCDTPEHAMAFDDRLGHIRVPIFYVDRTAAKLGTVERTASTDVTTLIVNPTLDPGLYGHADIFLANDAADVIWRPVLEWIAERR